MELSWVGFLLSLFLLLGISRRSLWGGLFVSTFTLGLFTLPFYRIGEEAYSTVTDPSILLLALGVGMMHRPGRTGICFG